MILLQERRKTWSAFSVIESPSSENPANGWTADGIPSTIRRIFNAMRCHHISCSSICRVREFQRKYLQVPLTSWGQIVTNQHSFSGLQPIITLFALRKHSRPCTSANAARNSSVNSSVRRRSWGMLVSALN